MKKTLPIYVIGLAFVVGCGGSVASIKSGPMPEGGSFSGVYHSPQYGDMNLVQTGNAVVGEYKKDERIGRINGSVEGDTLHFDWVERRALIRNKPMETRGKGYFKYMIDPSTKEHVIKGEWGVGDQMTGGGPWNAWKSLRAKPHLSEESESSESSGGTDETSGGQEGQDEPGSSGGQGSKSVLDDL
jgi:hypothetical protein